METENYLFRVGKFMINVKEKWIAFNYNSKQVYFFEKQGRKMLNVPELPNTLNLAELYAWNRVWSHSKEGIIHGFGLLEAHKREGQEFTLEFKNGYKFLIPPSILGTPEKPSTFLVEGFVYDHPFDCPNNVVIKYIPINKPKSRIFLSHSSKDKEFARWLAIKLKEKNHEVFFDEWEIKVGDSLIEKISEGLETHGYFAIVLSNASVTSNWVKKELNTAMVSSISNKNLKIFPLLLEDCEVPTLLREYKYADFRKSHENGFNELIFAIESN